MLRRFGHLPLVGEIAVGLLLGPTLLGRAFPALHLALFPSGRDPADHAGTVAWFGILFAPTGDGPGSGCVCCLEAEGPRHSYWYHRRPRASRRGLRALTAPAGAVPCQPGDANSVRPFPRHDDGDQRTPRSWSGRRRYQSSRQRTVPDPHACAEALLARESAIGTGTGRGVAVPHTRLEGLERGRSTTTPRDSSCPGPLRRTSCGGGSKRRFAERSSVRADLLSPRRARNDSLHNRRAPGQIEFRPEAHVLPPAM